MEIIDVRVHSHTHAHTKVAKLKLNVERAHTFDISLFIVTIIVPQLQPLLHHHLPICWYIPIYSIKL